LTTEINFAQYFPLFIFAEKNYDFLFFGNG